MNRKPLASIGLGLALALGSTLAWAQDAPPATDPVTKPLGGAIEGDGKAPAPKASETRKGDTTSQKVSFGALDVNSDRKVTRDEARASGSLSSSFEQYDANKDGALSDGEFAKFEAGAKSGGSSSESKDKSRERSEKAEDKMEKGGNNAEQELEGDR